MLAREGFYVTKSVDMNTYITLQLSSYQQHTICIVLILTEMRNNARAKSSLSSPANVSVMSQH